MQPMRNRLGTVGIVAWSTFKQGLRGRLFFLTLTSVIAVFLLGNVFRNFATKANLELRLILETGLALSALVVLGTAILLACRGLGQGDERASYQVLFSLPISRDSIYWGHLSGIALTLAAFTSFMALSLIVVLFWRFGIWRSALLLHFFTLFVEGMILSVIASFLALGRSTVVAFFGTLAIAIVAHAESLVLHLAKDSGHFLIDLAVTISSKFLPALAALDMKVFAVRDLPIPWSRFAWAMGHSLIYVVVLLFLSSLLRRRIEGA